jgi:hypothetical protein
MHDHEVPMELALLMGLVAFLSMLVFVIAIKIGKLEG